MAAITRGTRRCLHILPPSIFQPWRRNPHFVTIDAAKTIEEETITSLLWCSRILSHSCWKNAELEYQIMGKLRYGEYNSHIGLQGAILRWLHIQDFCSHQSARSESHQPRSRDLPMSEERQCYSWWLAPCPNYPRCFWNPDAKWRSPLSCSQAPLGRSSFIQSGLPRRKIVADMLRKTLIAVLLALLTICIPAAKSFKRVSGRFLSSPRRRKFSSVTPIVLIVRIRYFSWQHIPRSWDDYPGRICKGRTQRSIPA